MISPKHVRLSLCASIKARSDAESCSLWPVEKLLRRVPIGKSFGFLNQFLQIGGIVFASDPLPLGLGRPGTLPEDPGTFCLIWKHLTHVILKFPCKNKRLVGTLLVSMANSVQTFYRRYQKRAIFLSSLFFFVVTKFIWLVCHGVAHMKDQQMVFCWKQMWGHNVIYKMQGVSSCGLELRLKTDQLVTETGQNHHVPRQKMIHVHL